MIHTWTEQHSIDLIEAYIGAAIERSPMGKVWIAGDEWRTPLPDLSKDGEWLMRCVDSYFKLNKQLGWMTLEVGPYGILAQGYCMRVTECDTPRQALAWALWEARGEGGAR